MPFRRLSFPITLTLFLGTGLTVLSAAAVARWERANYRLQFQRQTDNLTTALQRSINRYTDLLLALGDFYSVSETVSRSEFNRFVERALLTYPGIQALEWAPLVTHDNRSAFEATVQAEGYPSFQITERKSRGYLAPATLRSIYVPVTFLQPWTGNELAFGYDLTSDLTRQQALDIARDTGQIAASGRIRLVQENKNQFGFLVFHPLYAGSRVPVSQADRRDQLKGYLLGVFRVSDVVEESLETIDVDIDFTLTDRTAASPEAFLGRYDSATKTLSTDAESALVQSRLLCPKATDCTRILTTGGREWSVAFAPAAGYPAFRWMSALSTVVAGLLLTFVVARYLSRTRRELARTQELSKLKIRLFSMASHELRTPLSTILLSAQTLETTALDTPHRRTYQRIRSAAKRMNQLLNDLLTLSRAESGRLQFVPEIVDLQAYTRQLIEEVQFSFEPQPEIALRIRKDCGKAYVDPQLLRAILTNLLSNAVKYSSPTLEVSLTVISDSHTFTFQVQDQGIGISETDRGQLYEAFYRGSNVGNIRGTGLGLAVVQACVRLHNGELTCHSQLGKGALFEVSLPRIE